MPAVETAVLRDPLRRCAGIAVLLAGLVGLLALGGAGWSVEAAVADGSSGAEEIALLEGIDLDFGADYRGSEAAAGGTATTKATVAAAIVDGSDLGDVLIAPADRSEALRIGGYLYSHVISGIGAALVAGRALIGWRIDPREFTLAPRDGPSSGGRSGPDRHPTLRADGGSRRGK